MSFNSPPPSFLPPSPPRKSRSGGIILLIAGILGAGSPFIAWAPDMGASKASLKAWSDALAGSEGIPVLDNYRTWFYALLAGGVVAIVFGLIAILSGGKGANATAGIFGLIAAVAIAYPPIWLMTALKGALGFADVGAGFYAAAVGGFLALLGMLFAFIGAAKK